MLAIAGVKWMNNAKILIVIAQFNKTYVDRLIESMKILEIPVGYEVEILVITDVMKKIEAYRRAVLGSEAKYKIFIDEKTVIKDKNFLNEIITTFNQDEKIGAIGVIGSSIVPTDAKIRHNTRRIGEMEFTDIKFVNWSGDSNIADVIAVEEYVLATSCDTAWFDIGLQSDEFLFTTQCIELKEKGYKSVINRELGKCISWEGNNEREYNQQDCKLFMDTYYDSVMPLVQVLIPTYNRPDLLKIALESALNQTYKHIEIIISDNNDHNEATFNMLKPYMGKDNRIKYFHQKGKDFGINEQFTWLKNYDNPKAEYVSWLMDDDVYYPDKIAVMIDYYLQYDGISIVTSARDFIDEDGNKYEVTYLNKPICSVPTRFSGNQIGKEMLMRNFNFIGEPTTVLLKKTYLNNGNIGWNDVEGEYVIIDFPRWLELMTKGDLVYIPTVHSALRLHSIRDSNNPETKLNILLCWILDIKYAWENNYFLTTKDDFEKTILQWLSDSLALIQKFSNAEYNTPRFLLVKKVFSRVAESLHNGNVLNLEIM